MKTLDGPTDTETLYGGSALNVKLRTGAAEAVFVRQLEIKDYPNLLDALGDECVQIELYCDRPAGWARTLAPESHEAVIDEAERINGDFFGRWLLRTKARQERVAPGLADKIMQQALQSSAPKPPSPPAASIAPLPSAKV